MSRLRALGESGLVHPSPAAVQAPLFTDGRDVFLAAGKVQVKYEMLRTHLVDGLSVTDTAAAHGYSRAVFYLVSASFEQRGMAGLLDERRGRLAGIPRRDHRRCKTAMEPEHRPARRVGGVLPVLLDVAASNATGYTFAVEQR